MRALIIWMRATHVPNSVLIVMHAKIRKRHIQLNRYVIYTPQCTYLYRYGLEMVFYICYWLPLHISSMIAAKSKCFCQWWLDQRHSKLKTSENRIGRVIFWMSVELDRSARLKRLKEAGCTHTYTRKPSMGIFLRKWCAKAWKQGGFLSRSWLHACEPLVRLVIGTEQPAYSKAGSSTASGPCPIGRKPKDWHHGQTFCSFRSLQRFGYSDLLP